MKKKKTKILVGLTLNESKKIYQALVEADTVIKVLYDENTLLSVSKALELFSNKISGVKK